MKYPSPFLFLIYILVVVTFGLVVISLFFYATTPLYTGAVRFEKLCATLEQNKGVLCPQEKAAVLESTLNSFGVTSLKVRTGFHGHGLRALLFSQPPLSRIQEILGFFARLPQGIISFFSESIWPLEIIPVQQDIMRASYLTRDFSKDWSVFLGHATFPPISTFVTFLQKTETSYHIPLSSLVPLLRHVQVVVLKDDQKSSIPPALVAISLLSEEQLQTISSLGEDIISRLLAMMFPERRMKKLPDGTSVEELIFNPQRFAFSKVSFEGMMLRSVRYEPLDIEISSMVHNGRLFFSNSREGLIHVLGGHPSSRGILAFSRLCRGIFSYPFQSSLLLFLSQGDNNAKQGLLMALSASNPTHPVKVCTVDNEWILGAKERVETGSNGKAD